MAFYHVSIIHSLAKYVRKMLSMSQKRLCWNNAVTMETPQIFFSQPSILYPRYITESKKYGFALFYRGEGFTFFILLAAALLYIRMYIACELGVYNLKTSPVLHVGLRFLQLSYTEPMCLNFCLGCHRSEKTVG